LDYLGLLDAILEVDFTFIVASGTRDAVEMEYAGFTDPHPIAKRLREWLLRNRSRVRMRSLASGRESDDGDRHQQVSGIWTRRRPTSAEMLTDGVGETLTLAQELGLPLYSDEVAVRQWASERGVHAFSTLALLRRLRQEQRVSIQNETALVAKMMASNFRYIPVSAEHFDAALASLLRETNTPDLAAITAHSDLGPLLGMFGEMQFTNESLLGVAFEWWILLLGRTDLADSVIESIVATICYRFQHRTGEGVLKRPSADKPGAILSEIAALFLFATLRRLPSQSPRCWWIVKHVVERLNREENEAIQILQSGIAERFYRLLKRHSGNQLAADLMTVTEALPEPERSAWQRLLITLAKRDRLVH
jgi:hypothetical protein